MADYPKALYKPNADTPGFQTLVVASEADKDRALGQGWHESPADFGVETAPGSELEPEGKEGKGKAGKEGKEPVPATKVEPAKAK